VSTATACPRSSCVFPNLRDHREGVEEKVVAEATFEYAESPAALYAATR
jgi:hypothetical protein